MASNYFDLHQPALQQILHLERIENDIYRAVSPLHPRWGRVYGGQLVAQSITAAGYTINPSTHQIHNYHCYFLRPGDDETPLVYQVHRLKDSRSFVSRRVDAIQFGQTIFTALVSFCAPDANVYSHTYRFDISTVPPVDALPSFRYDMYRLSANEQLPPRLRKYLHTSAKRPIPFDIKWIHREDVSWRNWSDHPLPREPKRTVYMRIHGAIADDYSGLDTRLVLAAADPESVLMGSAVGEDDAEAEEGATTPARLEDVATTTTPVQQHTQDTHDNPVESKPTKSFVRQRPILEPALSSIHFDGVVNPPATGTTRDPRLVLTTNHNHGSATPVVRDLRSSVQGDTSTTTTTTTTTASPENRHNTQQQPQTLSSSSPPDRNIHTSDVSDVQHPLPAPSTTAPTTMTATPTLTQPSLASLLHCIALAYMSDWGMIAVSLKPHSLPTLSPNVQLASLDHVMTFYNPTFRADEWLLFDIISPVMVDSRATLVGCFYTLQGELIARVQQEALVRVKTGTTTTSSPSTSTTQPPRRRATHAVNLQRGDSIPLSSPSALVSPSSSATQQQQQQRQQVSSAIVRGDPTPAITPATPTMSPELPHPATCSVPYCVARL